MEEPSLLAPAPLSPTLLSRGKLRLRLTLLCFMELMAIAGLGYAGYGYSGLGYAGYAGYPHTYGAYAGYPYYG